MPLQEGEKGNNLSAEYGFSKQQISDIRKNKEMSMKFADILETNKRLKRKSLKVAHDEQFDKALYAWVYSATNIWQSNFWSPKQFLTVLFPDCVLFS